MTFTDSIGPFLGVNVGTPLQRKLSQRPILLFVIAVVCAIIVEAANFFSGRREVVIYAVATGLSMTPASLIVVLTITMAMGTRSMVSRNVIVRKMDALEALGAVTDVCSDKTGTLTQGKMVAKKCWIPFKGTYSVGTSNQPYNPTAGDLMYSTSAPYQLDAHNEKSKNQVAASSTFLQNNEELREFLLVASLANLAHVHKSVEGEWLARGDPTEIALQVFASRFDYNRLTFVEGDQAQFKQVSEYPFDSDVKKMSVIFEDVHNHSQMVYTKGPVERVIGSCEQVKWNSNQLTAMNMEMREEILRNADAIAGLGLRVLAAKARNYGARFLYLA